MNTTRPLPRPNPRDARLEHFADLALESGRLLPGSGPLLIGVSGGPDSIALLHFLLARSLRTATTRPVAAHVNHGLRGRESDEDERFVRRICSAWGIPCLFRKLRAERAGSEEAARNARYDAFREMTASSGASRIAVAHTADDQVETVLLRLVRGTGLRGLAGMSARARVRGLTVVRPFLSVTRDQVLDYLHRHRLEARQDLSNESLRWSRNFVRREIVPRLTERLNPSAREAILRAAQAAREADAYFSGEARRLLPGILTRERTGEISLDAASLRLYPKPLSAYLFRLALEELTGGARDLSGVHIDALLSLARGPGRRSTHLSGGVLAVKARDRIVLRGRNPEHPGSRATSKA